MHTQLSSATSCILYPGDTQAFVNLNKQIPLHFPCIQWITRHLLLLTVESKLHSHTSSMHTVDYQAFATLDSGIWAAFPYLIHAYSGFGSILLFHPMTNKDDFYMGPHACCDPSFIQSLLIQMLHLQPALRWAQSVHPQLTSWGPKALHQVVLQISRISNKQYPRFTFHLYMYYLQPPTRIWYPQGYFHTLLSSSPTQVCTHLQEPALLSFKS